MSYPEVLRAAVDRFGEDSQRLKAAEECAELAAALLQQGFRPGTESIDRVIEEIADVQIMLDQLRILYDPQAIDEWIEAKIARLERRIAE